jgi:hypothetical protein
MEPPRARKAETKSAVFAETEVLKAEGFSMGTVPSSSYNTSYREIELKSNVIKLFYNNFRPELIIINIVKLNLSFIS